MSSLPDIDQLVSKAEVDRQDTNLNTDHQHHETSDAKSIPDPTSSQIRPATKSTSCQPSECSESTNASRDDRVDDNASSDTLRDEFPCHQSGVDKHTQDIPSVVVPSLLQGVGNVSPSQLPWDEEEDVSHEADEVSDDSGNGVPLHSATQKGKWKARTNGEPAQNASGNIGRARPFSPQFHFSNIYNTSEDWVVHTRPILQDYANRQTSLPLGRRLEVTINEPPKFILGAIQLLVNRDQKACADRSRMLGPQLIENFVDIDRWAKDYFRYRHGTQIVDSDVPALLTIVINNFYEGQVQLIDRLVEFALENMHFCGRNSLSIEDFAFGFDFKMSQDLPFYVETSSRIREPLPIPTVDIGPSTLERKVTHSGRQVKPTKWAQAISDLPQVNVNGRRNKCNSPSQGKGKETANTSVPPSPQKKKSSAKPSFQRTIKETSLPPHDEPDVRTPDPPQTSFGHTKYRPTRPSNLGSSPAMHIPSSTTGITSESRISGTADSSKGSGSGGVKSTTDPLPRLKIRLPALSLSTLSVPATRGSKSTRGKTRSPTIQIVSSAETAGTMKKGRGAPRPGVARPRGLGNNGRGRGRGRDRESASGTTSSAEDSTTRLHTARNNTGIRDDDPPTSQNEPLPLVAADPGHPQQKKRKLDDCED